MKQKNQIKIIVSFLLIMAGTAPQLVFKIPIPVIVFDVLCLGLSAAVFFKL